MKRPTFRTQRALKAVCDDFNARHPIGSIVQAWLGEKGDGKPRVGAVRVPGAYVLSGHTPVVFVAGVRGCVALTHVQAVLDGPPEAA